MSEVFDLPRNELLVYRGSTPRPRDFDAYWDDALAELANVDPEPVVERAEFDLPFAHCSDLWFRGTQGAHIHARLWQPRSHTGPTPVLLMFHGLGMRAPDWTAPSVYVAVGFTVAALDCRGQGGRSEDPGGVSGWTQHGFLIRGLMDDPRAAYYRQVFLDGKRLVEVVLALPDIDPEKVGAIGASQGGGLTIAAAALEPRITHIAPMMPYLSDYRRVWDMELAKDAYFEIENWFRTFDPVHEREDEVFSKLGYIDVSHLAARVRARILMTMTHADRICPPSTQFAVFNALRGPKVKRDYFDYGHEPRLPGSEDANFQFFLAMARGASDAAGTADGSPWG